MKIDIYLILNPIGILNAEKQIGIYSNETDRNRVLINYENFKTDNSIWNKVYTKNSNNFYNCNFLNNLKKAFFYKYFLKDLKKNKINHINFYFQNLECPLSNHFFFNHLQEFGSEISFSFYIIEEGIANYYENYLAFPAIKRRLIKKIIFFYFFGLRMKLSKSQTGSTYEKVEKIYVNLPKYSLCPEKSLPLSSKKINVKCNNNTILILGQESESINYGELFYINKLNELISYISKRFSNKKILYKPHWDSRITAFDKIKNSYKKKNSFELITNTECIETIIDKINPSMIISFSTSAFINLRILLDDESNAQIEMYYHNSFNTTDEITNLFKMLNINPLDTL